MDTIDNLKNFNWDVRYSSATHNLINDFFIPALSRSKYYYRIAGYFSSTSIAASARGISAFIENGEKMYLIIGSQLTIEDVEAINKGIKKTEDILYKKWEECKVDFSNDTIKKRFELLSWLIANGKLEIKIGINKDNNGKLLPHDISQFHEKILIFEDYNENRIQIDGSVNETWKAWKTNRESFCVHKSWIEGQKEFIGTAKKYFDSLWSNSDVSSEILELPDAIKQDLISIRPNKSPITTEEPDFSTEELDDLIVQNNRVLRNYQRQAIDSWGNHNYLGILEMATGTGKTFTALNAIKELNLESKILLISVPQIELANQWAEECENIFQDIKKIIIICTGDSPWKKYISLKIRQSYRENCLCIIITVFNTMRSNEFLDKISKYQKDTYIIIDEVHEIGSTENKKILLKLNDIKYRLGLSATPTRIWDDEGNQAIWNYFNGPPIFVWDLERAINPPEGYEACLCEYEYHIHECNLDTDELQNYLELSKKINQQIAIKTKGGRFKIKDIDDDLSLTKLLNERSDIIKECNDKLRILRIILDKESDSLKKCLVYCNDKEHMDKATRIILERGYNCLKFYGELDSDVRNEIFDKFENGNVRFLVAIKCLDQGIDLPICDSAIILASSSNPREYIQRRGRVLRLHKNKTFAIIHDIMVFPYNFDDLKSGRKTIEGFEAKILDKELKRMDIFMDNSKNKVENFIKKLEYGNIIINAMKRNNYG